MYGGLPFYNRLFHRSGLAQEASAVPTGDAQVVTDRMAEELLLLGPASSCRGQLVAFRTAGVQLSIIRPVPIADQSYVEAVRTAIETFA